MSIRHESIKSVEIIVLPARLSMAESGDIRESINALIEKGCEHLVLDLEQVNFIDSSGLSVLVSTLKAVTPHQGGVVLLSPSNGVRSLIELTRLHQVFAIFEDLAAALHELGSAEVSS